MGSPNERNPNVFAVVVPTNSSTAGAEDGVVIRYPRRDCEILDAEKSGFDVAREE